MSPSEHLDWLDDNVEWFSGLAPATLSTDVPNCPGWHVDDVLSHLAFGLGRAYPHALRTPPEASADDAFAAVPWPSVEPRGVEALAAFTREFAECLAIFRATEPSTPCWTYAGPGTAAFWFRRAAIETTLHRMDVVDAIGVSDAGLSIERSSDAVAETIAFALPLAAALTGLTPAAILVEDRDTGVRRTLGIGRPAATLSGSGTAVLAALWGRAHDQVEISGDGAAVSEWLGAVGTAFARETGA